MKSLYVILLTLTLVVKDAYAKPNIVSQMVDELLRKVSAGNLTIPEIELGQPTNRLSDVVIVARGLEQTVDGDGKFGFKMAASVPSVQVTGNYDIELLDIPNLFPLFGKGKFSIDLENLQANFNVKARLNFTTEKFDVTTPVARMSVGTSNVFFENLMNHPQLADFLNELISSLVPDVFAVLQEFLDYAHPVIEYFVNEVITCIKLESLTGKVEECIRNIKMPPLNQIS